MENNLKTIVDFLKTKITEYIKVLQISDISVIADYFVIVSVKNTRSVDSIRDDLINLCAKENIEIRNVEGKSTGWVLIDCNDIIIHLFTEDDRKFYNIEKVWADAKVIDIDELA